MSLFDLSKEDEQKANAAAGSTLAMLFRGGAAVWSAAGKTVKFTSDHTASALRWTADKVENGGNATAEFCERRSEGCTKKALKYSGFSEEEVEVAMQALMDANFPEEKKVESPTEATVKATVGAPKFQPIKKAESDEPREGRAPIVNAFDVEPAI